MADRRWTVMVVPHGSDSPRSYSISERAVRVALYVGAVLGLMAAIGLGTAIATTGRYITGAIRPTEANAMSSHPRDLSEVAKRVASLRDTLEVIRKREAQIRLLAGLPATDSGAQILATAQDSLADSATRSLPHADVETLIRARGPVVGSLRGGDGLAGAQCAAVRQRPIDHADAGLAHEPVLAESQPSAPAHFATARGHRRGGADGRAHHRAGVRRGDAGRLRERVRQHARDRSRQRHRHSLCTLLAHRREGRPARHARPDASRRSGAPGLATGPHLHYEIHINGKVVNPLTYVLSDAIPD